MRSLNAYTVSEPKLFTRHTSTRWVRFSNLIKWWHDQGWAYKLPEVYR